MPLNQSLTAEKALIFRITHRANLPWILQNGLHCSRSTIRDPGFVTIGNTELIAKRSERQVPVAPGGTLADYVPFYFTPFSPMLYNIVTGYGGIPQRPREEIVILVSSLADLPDRQVEYLFTDRHAHLLSAQFFSDRADLNRVDYELLQRRDFQRDREDPGKFERYQAEALVHRHVPVGALRGVACYTEQVKQTVAAEALRHGVGIKAIVQTGWYL